jgi:hypothetical protein
MVEVNVTLEELDRVYSQVEQIRALVESGGTIKLIFEGRITGIGTSGGVDREKLGNALAHLHSRGLTLIRNIGPDAALDRHRADTVDLVHAIEALIAEFGDPNAELEEVGQ